MTPSRILIPVLFLLCAFHASAQPLIRDDLATPEGQNVRASWVIDANGDVDGDDYDGFMLAYASKIYPLDQMVISYIQLNPDQSTMHQVLLSIEEHWPVCEWMSPYGVAGAGYIWSDLREGTIGDSTGWYGKIGGGLLFKTGTAFDVYAELAYLASDRDLWLDGRNATDSDNVQVLLGVRMNY